MKKVLLFIACLFVTGLATAQKVSIKDAKAAVEYFLDSKTTRSSSGELQLAHTFMSLDGSECEDLYVFNSSADGKYVVVAADERVGDIILGFGDSGLFDYDTAPDNLKWWLNEYVRGIDHLRKNVAEVKKTRGRAGVKASESQIIVQPLLGGMIWDQYAPFNDMCPTVDGQKTLTGCIATAMAMIMNYHKWPKSGKGQHADRYKPTEYVDFSQSVYDWDNMIDDYTKGYNADQANAVAKLMYDCGVAVDMQYGTDGSAAYSTDVPDVLKKYFDYDESLRAESRESLDDFEGTLIEELKAKRPINYSGVSTEENGGGHAFICDGYMKNNNANYFHFNFGWSGSGNGFFKTMDIEFKTGQYIIYGIKANNKTQVGSVYYNLLNETAAQVTFPADGNEYQGRIEIPSSITVDGKTYSVTKIGPSAFGNMAQLTEVVIPQSVTNISENAFYGCSALKNIVVRWTSDIPCINVSAFDDNTLSNAALVVPDDMVEQYATMQPWMMFCTIKDNKNNVIEFGQWTSFESGSGKYTFSILYGGYNSCDVVSRCYKSDENKLQVTVKKWMDDASLIFTYDKLTNKCTVPAQSTNYTTQYNTAEGETKTGTIFISDIPTYSPDDCTYEEYPCSYNPSTGYFRLNVVYYVEEGAFGIGEETLKMEGDQYKDYSVTISSKAKVVEKDDRSATQKLTVEGGKDVSKFRYAVVTADVIDNTSVTAYAQKIADGTVESNVKSKGFINVITVSYPQPGQYYVIVISLDADNVYNGDYTYLDVDYVSTKEWEDKANGSYTYSVWFTKSDGSARRVNDKVLSQKIADPSLWKISDIFNGVDFEFTWDQTTDIVTFYNQKIGEEYQNYGEVYVSDCNQLFPEGNDYHGADSYFNRGDETFYFNNVYHGTKYAYALGVETFNVPGLATDISQAKSENNANSQQPTFNLAGQIVNDSYKGVVINNGKKYLKK